MTSTTLGRVGWFQPPSDVSYSPGGVCYEMLYGLVLFEGNTSATGLARLRSDPPTPCLEAGYRRRARVDL
jgi:hypothetical protein